MKKNKFLAIVLLIIYVGIIVYITLLSRKAGLEYQYNYTLFWSYRHFFDESNPQARQILLNIVLFIPFGTLITVLLEKYNWKRSIISVAFIAGLFSAGIELLQLVLNLGFSELDDVFDNTLGAVMGSVIFILINSKWKKE